MSTAWSKGAAQQHILFTATQASCHNFPGSRWLGHLLKCKRAVILPRFHLLSHSVCVSGVAQTLLARPMSMSGRCLLRVLVLMLGSGHVQMDHSAHLTQSTRHSALKGCASPRLHARPLSRRRPQSHGDVRRENNCSMRIHRALVSATSTRENKQGSHQTTRSLFLACQLGQSWRCVLVS